MAGETTRACLVFRIMLLITFVRKVQGCFGTFPSVGNTSTECSYSANLTTCFVTCTADQIFYDGNNTKNFSCDSENIWTPSIPKYGCLEKRSTVYTIRLLIDYRSSAVIAAYCRLAHQQALSENKNNTLHDISRLCNYNRSIAVGDIVIKDITSVASSFDIRTTVDLLISNASASEHAVYACAETLAANIRERILVLHNDTLECSAGRRFNVTTHTARREVEESCMNDSFVLIKSDNKSYCVPNIPIIGVKQLSYGAYMYENITIYSDILFGTLIEAVYWTHNNENLTITSNTKYSGGTIDLPSLTINNITTEDTGEYVCHVSNMYGTGDSEMISLTITSTYSVSMTTPQKARDTTGTNTETDGDSATTEVGMSTETTQHYINDTEDSSDVYIAVGTGGGVLFILMIIFIVLIKRKIFRPKRDIYDNVSQPYRVNSAHVYDGFNSDTVRLSSEKTPVNDYDVYYNDVTLASQRVTHNDAQTTSTVHVSSDDYVNTIV